MKELAVHYSEERTAASTTTEGMLFRDLRESDILKAAPVVDSGLALSQ
jgi:hypothetical protein